MAAVQVLLLVLACTCACAKDAPLKPPTPRRVQSSVGVGVRNYGTFDQPTASLRSASGGNAVPQTSVTRRVSRNYGTFDTEGQAQTQQQQQQPRQFKRGELEGIEHNRLTARSATAHEPPLVCHDPAILAAMLKAMRLHPPPQPYSGPKIMSSTMAWDGLSQAKDTSNELDLDRRIHELRYIPPDVALQTGQSLWKFVRNIEMGGVPHYFVSHASPWVNARDEVTEHTCYHLYMKYGDITSQSFVDWEGIKDRVEVRTGCAIYKTKAQRMQRFVKCIQPILNRIPNENPESQRLGNFHLGVRQHVGLTVSYNQFTAGNLEPQVAHWARWAHKARSFDEWLQRVLGPDDQKVEGRDMTRYKKVEWGLLNKWDRKYNPREDAELLAPQTRTAPSTSARLSFSTYWQRIKRVDGSLHSNAALADGGNFVPLKSQAQQQVDYTDLRTAAWQCFDTGTQQDHELLMDTFRCLPAMYGAPGVLSHGVGNQDHTWFELAYGQVENDIPTHPTCARLASEQLAHFGGLDYPEGLPEYVNKIVVEKCLVRGLQSWDRCVNRDVRGADLAQCGLYPACWELAIRRVCAAESACCPSDAVAQACRADSESDACRQGMNVDQIHKVRFDHHNPHHAETLGNQDDQKLYNAAVQALEVPTPTLQELRSIGVLPPRFMMPLARDDGAIDQLLGSSVVGQPHHGASLSPLIDLLDVEARSSPSSSRSSSRSSSPVAGPVRHDSSDHAVVDRSLYTTIPSPRTRPLQPRPSRVTAPSHLQPKPVQDDTGRA